MIDKPFKPVAVVLERLRVEGPWATDEWRVAAVMTDIGGEPRVLVDRDGLYHKVFPGLRAVIHRDEAEGYYLNVTTEEPSLFVALRFDEATGEAYAYQVTLSYHEAARWMDGGERVERAAVDADIARWLGEWVEANYRPEKKERQRPKSFKGREGRLRERG
jgi:hypothetical protein